MSRELRPGPASMKGLEWLARVGPSPLDPWRYSMGWSEVAARNHIRIELLDPIKSETVAAFESTRTPAERTAA
jgi:hypothetical protein